ncbi:ImmA/IrrE family metallo-endopeptidase (plasmid) [Bradyrhizobium sp. 62B]|uniref:ImmA/IrrE family metallo-endopeptidase n=1 Tax=Bradyrhizobium sp. 62B TaxID=2898442 RepID=UPI002557CC56|nr:ImmA/IrrE family metallo-endopeptidase [Bradyrhizobium sp. 62B]
MATASIFDPRRIMEFLIGKAESTAVAIRSAISKMFGVADTLDNTIHIDHTVRESKQNFLKLHEAGHLELPAHRKIFRIFQDCEKMLDPDISDLFEREANNFAGFVMFQGNGYRDTAADHPLSIRTPMKLASKFGASIYASCREFARTNHRACAVYVLEPITYHPETGARAEVRRVEVSPSFGQRFGRPADTVITRMHSLGRVLPIGRKMSRATPVSMTDLNGQAHECLAEAFDTTFNVLILVYPKKALTPSVFA